MSTVIDQLRHYAVKVNEGSGCLFQPNTNDYTYVLTVKHNLKKTEDGLYEAEIKRFNLTEKDKLKVIQIYPHQDPNIDLALIKVEYIGKSDFNLMYSQYEKEAKVRVFGYPKNAPEEDEIKTDSIICNCDIDYQVGKSFIIISQTAQHTFNSSAGNNVVGFSGSGIFHDDDGIISLQGIFPRLNNPEGSQSSLHAYNIECFNDIIEANTLIELMPSCLLDFAHYENLAFRNIGKHIKALLVDDFDKVYNHGLTPIMIANSFKGELYIPYNEQYRRKLINENLWKGWLELLTVLYIINDHPEINMDQLLKDMRMMYANETIQIPDIIHQIVHDNRLRSIAKQNNCIIINSNISPSRNLYLKNQISKIITNNSRASETSVLEFGTKRTRHIPDIDNALIPLSFSCLHISYLIDKIGKIEDLIMNDDDNISIELIKETLLRAFQDVNS